MHTIGYSVEKKDQTVFVAGPIKGYAVPHSWTDNKAAFARRASKDPLRNLQRTGSVEDHEDAVEGHDWDCT